MLVITMGTRWQLQFFPTVFLGLHLVPSGNLLHSYWKWPLISWLFPWKMVIFPSVMLNYQRVYFTKHRLCLNHQTWPGYSRDSGALGHWGRVHVRIDSGPESHAGNTWWNSWQKWRFQWNNHGKSIGKINFLSNFVDVSFQPGWIWWWPHLPHLVTSLEWWELDKLGSIPSSFKNRELL